MQGKINFGAIKIVLGVVLFIFIMSWSRLFSNFQCTGSQEGAVANARQWEANFQKVLAS